MPIFDPIFYRSRAGLKSNTNTLLHYTLVGRHQKISTSPWFDIQYYLRTNRDVARHNVDPLLHYIVWGGLEGRSPNPSFDGSYYLRTYPDVAESRLNPLLHYIEIGRSEGRSTRLIVEAEAVEETPPPELDAIHEDKFVSSWDALELSVVQKPEPTQVAVVIPVYRDRRLTWRCIASVLTAKCETPFRVLIIDDASPEPELQLDLDEFARRGWCELIRNKKNLGFVASVNRGMRAASGMDVVLLNSDTEVYPGWIDRLAKAAWRDPRTASVTPLSNNATIASYPRFLHDNPYPLEIPYHVLDQLTAEANAGVEVEVPTGVGFCMYLRKDALSAVGPFDESSFGKGYGEENDWCQRAILKGWRNVIAADTFVRHFGSASFQGERAQRVAHAMKVLNALHPTYQTQISEFIQQDPLLTCRTRLDWARLKHQTHTENILFACHNRGGGSERHLQEESQRLAGNDMGVFVLRPVFGLPTHVRIVNGRCRQLIQAPQFKISDIEGLETALRQLRITNIHSHGLVDLIPEAAEHLSKLALAMGVPFDVDIHDYKVICPRINLVDAKGSYCGEPAAIHCDTCLRTHGNDFGVTQIEPWRSMHHTVLKSARNIYTPDEDVAQRLHRYFPDLEFQIVPHEKIEPIKRYKRIKSEKPLHIVVIGAIGQVKGYNVLLACAKEVQKKNFPVRFTVLGFSLDDKALESLGVAITGRYQEHDVDARLKELAPDLVWLPAIWPETYSYTLSIALRCGFPVSVFDIGAPANRLRKLGLDDWILPFDLARSPASVIPALIALADMTGNPEKNENDLQAKQTNVREIDLESSHV